MKYSILTAVSRMLSKDEAGVYVGGPRLLRAMEAAGWLKASVARPELTLYDLRKLDDCCDRLSNGEFPEIPTLDHAAKRACAGGANCSEPEGAPAVLSPDKIRRGKTPTRPGYYTYQEAADFLAVSERTIRNHIKRGWLNPIGAQRPYRIRVEEVHALLPPRATIPPPVCAPPVESPFYTVRETMEYLRLSRATVDDLIKRGLLKCSLAFRHKRILKSDVHTFHARTSLR
jgi:excisionase family DNA binding protein